MDAPTAPPARPAFARTLAFCNAVDRLTRRCADVAAAAVLLACLISAGNAVVRYGWDLSSNAWLEIQWYLFALAVMLGAAHVLKRNEHVRVDILYARLSARGQALLDLFGLIAFVLPVTGLLAVLSWPVFARALASGEVSSNAGGLIRWPALLTLPLGFALVALQAVAEALRRVAFLRGAARTDTPYEKPLQ